MHRHACSQTHFPGLHAHTHTHRHTHGHCPLLQPHMHTAHTAATDMHPRHTHQEHTSAEPTCRQTALQVRVPSAPHRCRAPAPTRPLLLTHDTGQEHSAEAEAKGGQGPGPAPRERHFWGFCLSVLSSPGWGRGGGGCPEQSPPPATSPRPLAGTSEREGPGWQRQSEALPAPAGRPPSHLPSTLA